jgi:hypothetical protein
VAVVATKGETAMFSSTPETKFITRPIIYTVRGQDGEYTFRTHAHHFATIMELHTLSGMELVGIEGINGYKAPALSEPTFAHTLPSRKDIRNGAHRG